MKYVVLGVGSMGQIAIRDLVKTCPPSDKIIIADFDRARAKEVASSYRNRRVRAMGIDVKDVASTVKALRGAFAVINAVPFQYNLLVMEAALAAQIHYVDMGGLFHMTRKQLKLHKHFKAIKRLAIVGIGAAPGVTNLLVRDAADRMEKVREIHIRRGFRDNTRYHRRPYLRAAFSFYTVMDEFSRRSTIYTKGKFKFIEPLSGYEPYRFPPPVGERHLIYTIHSEIATLPITYRPKGVKEVTYKLSFERDFIERMVLLRNVGLGSYTPIQVGNTIVRPVDVVNQVIMDQAPPRPVGKRREYRNSRAIVKGTENGKKVTWVMDGFTSGMPAWGIGVDIDTGSPPSVAAQMIARKEITGAGVLPPERAMSPDVFFKHMKKRGLRVKATRKTGWSFPT
ncbi:MAG: saccharopine dehydrogenase NADP-binding domain-containing protein [Acidobacteriota bacterium]|nr:MAG: saccharopine dehydrogenase NADP-binding domain-containing protein [Acidobacteriota bacterium]